MDRIAESQITKAKLNISLTTQKNELIFLPVIKACSSFISIKACL